MGNDFLTKHPKGVAGEYALVGIEPVPEKSLNYKYMVSTSLSYGIKARVERLLLTILRIISSSALE